MLTSTSLIIGQDSHLYKKWMSTFGDARLCAKICGCTINNILGIYSEVTEDEMMNMYKKIETLDKIKMISKSES